METKKECKHDMGWNLISDPDSDCITVNESEDTQKFLFTAVCNRLGCGCVTELEIEITKVKRI